MGDLVEGVVKSVLGYGILLDVQPNVSAFVQSRYVTKTPLINEKVTLEIRNVYVELCFHDWMNFYDFFVLFAKLYFQGHCSFFF